MQSDNKEEVIVGNKLIAEFMGAKFHELDNDFGTTKEQVYWYLPGNNPNPHCNAGSYKRPAELDYHVRWDWLMPVVEKIKEYGKWTLQPGFATLELYRELAGYGNIESKRKRFSTSQMDWETENDEPVEWIFMVHHIVIQFIQWYNTQSQSTVNK